MSALSFPVLPGQGLGDDELELGHLLGAFGVQGEVRVFLHHRESPLFSRPLSVVLIAPDGVRRAATLRVRPGAGKRVLGRLDGLDDRDVAESLRDHLLAVPKVLLPKLDKGEFYVWQIEGADVVVAGEVVGTLVTVQPTAGDDILVIRTQRGNEFVPCVKEWVIDLDVERRVVELAPGALEDA